MGTIIGDGITFDDVLLVPGYSEVIPNEIDLSTHLTIDFKKKCRKFCDISFSVTPPRSTSATA